MANEFFVGTQLAADKYNSFRARGRRMRTQLQELSAQLDVDANARTLISIAQRIKDFRIEFAGYIGDADLQSESAARITQTPAYDIDAAITAQLALLDAAIAVMQGYNVNVLVESWEPNPATTEVINYGSFTPAQTAPFKAAIDAAVTGII